MQELEDRLFERWCRRGDTRALGELFDLASPRLLKLAIHLVGDPVEAEDLVQATFLAAIEQRTSVDASRPVMPWLSGVLAHKVLQHKRQAARTIDAERLALRAEPDPSQPLLGRELDGELAKALDQLDEPYRRVLVLRLRHGMAIADIAHVLERDPGTVRVQLHRGLEKLRALLPAALASSLLVGLVTTRGLAAVKAEVLREAALVAASSTSILGGLIVSKTLLAGAAAAIAVVAFFAFGRNGHEAASPRAPEVASADSAEQPRLLTPLGTVDERGKVVTPAAERATVEASRAVAHELSGTVVDAATRAPIAGAKLRIFEPREAFAFDLARERPELYEVDVKGKLRSRASNDWPQVVAPRASMRSGREKVLAYDVAQPEQEAFGQAISAADGTFSLPCGERGGVIECESAEYATRWRPARDVERPVQIALWRERDVRGVVRGPDGGPPSVPLELALNASVESGAHAEWNPGLDLDFLEGVGACKVRTESDGTFVARLGGSIATVSVLTPGWTTAMQVQYPLDQPLEVLVHGAPSFHFFDAATGAPIERVHMIGRDLSDRYVRWSGERSAPEGWLPLPGGWHYFAWEPSTTYSFTFWSEGYAPTSRSIANLPRAGVIEVPMERGSSAVLEGVVRRGDEPVRGAEVALLGHHPLQWSIDDDFVVDGALTGSDGGFRLTAPPGSYVLRVRTDPAPFFEYREVEGKSQYWVLRPIAGREPYHQVVQLPASAPLVVDLARTATLEVEIVDSLGAPRAGHVVALHSKDGRSALDETDEQGLVRFVNLPGGAFQAHTPLVTTSQSFGDGETREVELTPGETQRVRIEVPGDTGPRHARVVARDVGDYSGWSARYDFDEWQALARDGTVPMELASDHHEIEIRSPEGRHWHARLPNGAPDGYRIELQHGTGAYRGELLHADGTPWAGVEVHCSDWESCPQWNGTRASCVTDERGAFEFTGLSDCEYLLQFQTQLERSLWDDWGNELAGLSFRPSTRPSDPPAWITVRAAPKGDLVRVRGSLRRAGGERLVGATVVFTCRWSGEGGALEYRGSSTLTHTDDQGVFDVRLPRTGDLSVRVFRDPPQGGVLLEQALEPSPEALEAIELVVP